MQTHILGETETDKARQAGMQTQRLRETETDKARQAGGHRD